MLSSFYTRWVTLKLKGIPYEIKLQFSKFAELFKFKCFISSAKLTEHNIEERDLGIVVAPSIVISNQACK